MTGVMAIAPVWALDEKDLVSLKADVEALKSRVLKLPSLDLSGYADASYVYNFSEPDAGAGRSNRGRLFDTQPDGFAPNALVLNVGKPVSEASPYGFQSTLFFGNDARVIHSLGGGAPSDAFDLQQLYAEACAPVGKGLDLKLGKFAGLLGAEVTQSPLNWNFSRSLLFTYSQPGAHTGLLASYPVTDQVNATAGVVNGWDSVDDNNKDKTFTGSLAWSPAKSFSLTANAVTGAEEASDNHHKRTVADLVMTYKPADRWSFMANYDYGRESGLTPGFSGVPGDDTAIWQGLALYAKYDVTPRWSVAARGERFDDKDNVRTTFTGPGGTVPTHLRFYEGTLTSQWTFYEHLMVRLEYRYDKADERVFFRNTDGFVNYQNTLATEVAVTF